IFDPPDRSPRRQPLHVGRDVVPVTASIGGVPYLPVVRTGPDQATLDLRWSNREYDLAVELSEVVRHDSAGRYDARRIARREIRTDHGPVLSRIRRAEDHLAAVIHGLGIEWIDGERRRPVTTILRLVGRRIECVNPWTHRARELGACIVASDLVSVAARPHNVGVCLVRQRETRLASAKSIFPWRAAVHAAKALRRKFRILTLSRSATASLARCRVASRSAPDSRIPPHAVGMNRVGWRLRTAALEVANRCVARAAHRKTVVLSVGVDPVGNPVIDGDVVHLP